MALAKSSDPKSRANIGVLASPNVTTGTGTSEAGVGAVMPWADKLWFWTYPDSNGNGHGTGLWSMDASMRPTLVEERNVTSAARLIYADRLYIGDRVIDTDGTIHPITGVPGTERIAAFSRGASGFVWALTMAGSVYHINPTTFAATLEKSIYEGTPPTYLGGVAGVNFAHGKAMWSHSDNIHLIGAFNGNSPDGRLFSYNMVDKTVVSLDAGNNSWVEVAGSYAFKQHIFALGHDDLSVMLWMFNGITYSATPRKFRIPYPSRQQAQFFQQEWMRIRQVQTERYLMNVHGGMFQLSCVLTDSDAYATGMPMLEPVSRYTSTFTDFCFWNGSLVLGGNQTSLEEGNVFPNSGQPQSGLLVCHPEDMWGWGKPAGTGYWYKAASVTSGTTSDLMLMNGYDKKSLHIVNGAATAIDFKVKVYAGDATGRDYATITVAAGSYAHHEFPSGFGADWVAIQPQADCSALTAWVVYS